MWPFGKGKEEGGRDQSDEVARRPAPSAGADQCPVDDKTRQAWLSQHRSERGESSSSAAAASARAFLASQRGPDEYEDPVPRGKAANVAPSKLSTDRVISSIPRFLSTSGEQQTQREELEEGSGNWVYPSPAQFYNAMARKNHDPKAEDMNIVVPIHNAVNERAWKQILEWESIAGGSEVCGGPKLVSFQGRPKDITWKAWLRSLVGYQLPFDRHDWEVDRCGKRVKYVIDFYSGRGNSLSFYLDTRPSPATLEGCLLRVQMAFRRAFTRVEK
ncbi:cytochrome c and c1 heme-lyase [Acaromyces ingoldii]|uniref:Holocytochrome c-type synthase n=1 Tax=Acaromyces ingoldii TaxID=215250 RepID=A0A316YLD0_9BASI|nr:cytochrome c and c1 heme-lyase [Acaromyces ingoldii]PWN90187.1 cytochrome c and c1 heme-lyase [Acaromyces ingoldii]